MCPHFFPTVLPTPTPTPMSHPSPQYWSSPSHYVTSNGYIFLKLSLIQHSEMCFTHWVGKAPSSIAVSVQVPYTYGCHVTHFLDILLPGVCSAVNTPSLLVSLCVPTQSFYTQPEDQSMTGTS
jgi:hypothetical protein